MKKLEGTLVWSKSMSDEAAIEVAETVANAYNQSVMLYLRITNKLT